MTIQQARQLKVGSLVGYPKDRREAAGRGRVTHLSQTENRNHAGVPYIWVTVRYDRHRAAVWPSSRLTT